MILGMALGALALDKAIRQEHLFDRVKKLLNGLGGNLAVFLELQVDIAGQLAVFRGIGRVVVIKLHQKSGKIHIVFGMYLGNQLFRRNALFFSAQHDGGAMRVIGTDIMHGMALHFLETHPDIGLDILHQMPEVNAAVGIRQGGSNQDFAG